jgi:hypothetical protein
LSGHQQLDIPLLSCFYQLRLECFASLPCIISLFCQHIQSHRYTTSRIGKGSKSKRTIQSISCQATSSFPRCIRIISESAEPNFQRMAGYQYKFHLDMIKTGKSKLDNPLELISSDPATDLRWLCSASRFRSELQAKGPSSTYHSLSLLTHFYTLSPSSFFVRPKIYPSSNYIPYVHGTNSIYTNCVAHR